MKVNPPGFPSLSNDDEERPVTSFEAFVDQPSDIPLVTYTYEGEAIPDQAADLVELTEMVGVTDFG